MGLFYKIKQLLFVKLRILKFKILSDCKKTTGKPILYHPLLSKGKGTIEFGTNIQIGVIASPNYYSHYTYLEARNENSRIVIGDNVSINNAFSAIAFSKIEIKNNVLIGINCTIIDNDAHHLDKDKRHILPNSRDVLIEENVFIGSNVTILKGVKIGENSVIGNGSVVTNSIPKNVIAAGNPARVIKDL
jgi:acetyltransferase-like isoleucine patch superfamily enzyme